MAREGISLGKPDTLPSGKVRWSKMVAGRRWKSSAYDQDSRRNRSDAWAEFVDWRRQHGAETEATRAADPVRLDTATKIRTFGEVAELIGDRDGVKFAGRMLQMLDSTDDLGVEQLRDEMQFDDEPDPLLEVGGIIVEQRRQNAPTSPTLSAGAIVADHLAVLRAKVESGQAKPSSYSIRRVALAQFVEWFGSTRGLDTLTNDDVVQLWQWFNRRITDGENPTTLSTYHGQIKAFLDDAATDHEDIPRPPNLRSKKYTIKRGQSKVTTFTIEEIGHCLDNTSERLELQMLLMLNCGMTQVDVSDLHSDDIDWTEGRIIRRRSKESGAPTINWQLWDRTSQLLQLQGSRTGLALTKSNGKPLVSTGIKDSGVEWRRDAITSNYRHLVKKLKRHDLVAPDWHKTLKQLRKTSASLVETSPHGEFVDMFLDHSRVARKHYLVGQVVPQFDDAVKWLGRALGIQH